MASSSQCTGIAPNPDIAGIGVRAAIYVQALLSVIYPICFAADGVITPEESKTMSRISLNISLTACALLVSTVIQAATLGISLYHTLTILQLSWINGMTFMTVNSVAGAASMLAAVERSELDGTTSIFQKQMRTSVRVTRMKLRFLLSPEALVASAHFIAVGGVGLWTWNKIPTFGNQSECNPDTFIVILSKSVYVTHSAEIRRVSLALYGILVMPVENVVILGGVLDIIGLLGSALISLLGLPILVPILVIINLCGHERSSVRPHRLQSISKEDDDEDGDVTFKRTFGRVLFYSGIASTGTAMIILIANTEQMIRRSASIVQPGEGDWTLGQTLALLLLLLPIGDAVRVVFGIEEESWILGFLWIRLVDFFGLLFFALWRTVSLGISP
ncbi:hypothetical protein C8R46DRAFT_1252723 [Mycena filopes]|nr:hypothetical protein C8R46DRAFT_1252723 [Mycena filopes]